MPEEEQLSAIESRKAAMRDDPNPPTEKLEETIEQPSTAPAPGSKDANLAALRQKLTEQEAEITRTREYVQKYETLNGEFEKFTPVKSLLETQFGGDPNALTGHLETSSKRLTELEKAVQDKEVALQLADLKSSAWFQDNIAAPLSFAENQLRGITKNDDVLLQKVISLSPGDKTPTAVEIMAISEALKAARYDGDPNWVVNSLAAWKTAAVKAQSVEANHKGELAKIVESQQQAEIAKYNDQVALQKSILGRMVVDSGRALVTSVETEAPGLFQTEDLSAISGDARTYLENVAFNGNGGAMDWSGAGEMVMKAKLFDKLIAEGSLKEVLKARSLQREAGGADHVRPGGDSVKPSAESVTDRKARMMGGA